MSPTETTPRLRTMALPAQAIQTTNPPDDYQSALAAVTGAMIELKAAARPDGGWLQLVAPGDGNWMTVSTPLAPVFSVSLNTTATDAWNSAVQTLEQLAHELFSGNYGLMKLQQLRDAETTVRGLDTALSTAVTDLQNIITPLEQDHGVIDGTAVQSLIDQLNTLKGNLEPVEKVLHEPSPPVADVLRDAAAALTTFANQMAYIYWESNKVLLNAVSAGTGGIHDNVYDYLDAINPQIKVIDDIGLMLGRYTSTVAGDLPNGMAPISGDLREQPVWTAANAAVSHLIEVELDKLDVVARKVTQDLKTAYDNASRRMGPDALMFGVRSEAPLLQPLQSRKLASKPALRGRLAENPTTETEPRQFHALASNQGTPFGEAVEPTQTQPRQFHALERNQGTPLGERIPAEQGQFRQMDRIPATPATLATPLGERIPAEQGQFQEADYEPGTWAQPRTREVMPDAVQPE